MSEDLYVVSNINVDDDSVDLEYGGSRKDFFEVKYAGLSIRIAPGKTKILEEHLANHFAKHLIDHILGMEGEMIHNDALREPLLARIILRKADETDRSTSREPGKDRSIEPGRTETQPDTGN